MHVFLFKAMAHGTKLNLKHNHHIFFFIFNLGDYLAIELGLNNSNEVFLGFLKLLLRKINNKLFIPLSFIYSINLNLQCKK